jgi:flagellar biogenesis protein FliO
MSPRQLEEQLELGLLALALIIILLPFLALWWLWKALRQHDY